MSPPRPSTDSPKPGQRIAKLLARAGIASRREVERMIEEGRIAIDGVALDTPATILTSLQGVTVDGVPVKAPAPARLFLYHKPVGVLTAERDPQGRPTIYDRMPAGLPRLMPVGRLDLNTEGLLLLTTDGELKRQLELPSSGVERVYRARTFGEVSQEQLEELIHGIEIEGIRYGAIDANLERRTGRNQWIEVRITEGKNREVRRVLEHLGLQVSRLIRVAYGPFLLEDLPAGHVYEIRQHDLVQFRKDMKSARPEALRAEAPRGRPAPAGSRRAALPVPQPVRQPTAPHAAAAARDEAPAAPRAPRGRSSPTVERTAERKAPRGSTTRAPDDRPRREGRPERSNARAARALAFREQRGEGRDERGEARPARGSPIRAPRGGQAEPGARPERRARPERGTRTELGVRKERRGRPDRGDRPQPGERPARGARTDHGSRAERGDRPARDARPERGAPPERGARAGRPSGKPGAGPARPSGRPGRPTGPKRPGPKRGR